ncbi:hypothetical protein FB550_102394 [Neobacillus bataviensis]|uniref:Uncharacterized protein n=1 Tax=Neobacillus bataviensis TaxID=220685 RepID=A0A561DSM4_9BACI|nr:hypothetical protein [Neobacillus bataviensis]TWE06372.1 hypothetical protein FB550_102394 [Neobacillus bataviensis]
MKKLLFDNREYQVTEDIDKVMFKDLSERKIKINFSFSKDPNKNKIAKDGLTIFFTELFMGGL